MPDQSNGVDPSVSPANLSPRSDWKADSTVSTSPSSLEAQTLFKQLVQESLADLTQRRQALIQDVERLEQQKEQLQGEMRRNFTGVSQDMAVQVQGFKAYLMGSLQDLATAAEQLSLKVPESPTVPEPRRGSPASPRAVPQESPQPRDNQALDQRSAPSREQGRSPQPLNLQPAATAKQRSDRPPRPIPTSSPVPSPRATPASVPSAVNPPPQAAADISEVAHQMFGDNAKQIRQILDQYRHSPNYYGAPWQLRRTFDPIHADRVSQWFFDHGGRGALKTLGSRLQNVLVASAIISVLRVMYGDRLHTLILSDSPERLGEWRRGLQDCLGIARTDFGGQQGVALFEAPEALTQRAERLIQQRRRPLILIDNSQDMVHLSLLQYPLWLAFAPDLNAIPVYSAGR
ncbi:MAG: DUF3086 domain-containing protein [Leptolyngbyaceae bacterium]|nr:DUF3086 domain-containing protein [Leptolyngbyaceae bacterium]